MDLERAQRLAHVDASALSMLVRAFERGAMSAPWRHDLALETEGRATPSIDDHDASWCVSASWVHGAWDQSVRPPRLREGMTPRAPTHTLISWEWVPHLSARVAFPSMSPPPSASRCLEVTIRTRQAIRLWSACCDSLAELEEALETRRALQEFSCLITQRMGDYLRSARALGARVFYTDEGISMISDALRDALMPAHLQHRLSTIAGGLDEGRLVLDHTCDPVIEPITVDGHVILGGDHGNE